MKQSRTLNLIFVACVSGLIPAAAQSLYSPNGTLGSTTTPANGRIGVGTNAPNATVDIRGNGMFTGGLSIAYTTSTGANNGLILGTASKATAASGGQGAIQINSNDASSPLQAWMSLVTDSVASNRRLAIGAIEQNVSWRNVTLAEGGGNVGIGLATPGIRLSVAGGGGYTGVQVGTESGGAYLRWSREGRTSDANQLNIYDQDAGSIVATFKSGGSVGIGTTDPKGKLHIVGSLALSYGWYGADITDETGRSNLGWRWDTANGNQSFIQSSDGTTQIIATQLKGIQLLGGNVGIGTTNPTQKLSVNGTVRAKEVIVDTGWSDYVFDERYKLTALIETEAFVKAEKHLPGIPSAKEVAENGISVGEMQAKLLAKVEELTLYVIELKKENTALRGRVDLLEAQSPAK